jgi:hypothetical protein
MNKLERFLAAQLARWSRDVAELFASQAFAAW